MGEIKLHECDELPQLEMEFMNTVHCDELALVNALLLGLDRAVPEAEITVMLSDWLQHTVEHFAREERLMQEYRFLPYPIHKQEHKRALETLETVQEQWLKTQDKAALQAYIREDWWPWLLQHLSTMDWVTASFLSQHDIEVDL